MICHFMIVIAGRTGSMHRPLRVFSGRPRERHDKTNPSAHQYVVSIKVTSYSQAISCMQLAHTQLGTVPEILKANNVVSLSGSDYATMQEMVQTYYDAPA